MQSLRTVLPGVCDILGIRLDQAYERQRVLVKAGILKPRPGRGPGSGVPGTAQNLGTLLIALLLGDLREHSVSTVRAIANVKPVWKSPFYGNACFGEVLTSILNADSDAQGIERSPTAILILRDSAAAEIRYGRPGRPKAPYWGRDYGIRYGKGQNSRRLRVEGVLDGEALPMIRRVLANSNSGGDA